MNLEKEDGFNVYRGLQKPLVFKSFKGKFIYWAMATLLISFISAIILSTVLGVVAGAVGLIVSGLGGLLFINNKQKKGLHNKTKSAGTYVNAPLFKRHVKQ